MRLGIALAALLALPLHAPAQSATVVLPERVFTAVPFMVDVSLDCPPPGEAPPPTGCNGTTGIWFEVSERSAAHPEERYPLTPFGTSRLGPFTFHKPGRHFISILSLSREFPGEVNWLGEVQFIVQHPTASLRRR